MKGHCNDKEILSPSAASETVGTGKAKVKLKPDRWVLAYPALLMEVFLLQEPLQHDMTTVFLAVSSGFPLKLSLLENTC